MVSHGNVITNVFLCVQDVALIQKIMEMKTEQANIKIIGISTVIPEDLKSLIQMHCHILIIQYDSHNNKMRNLLQEISKEEKLHNMKLILLLKDMDQSAVDTMLSYHIQNFLVEPFDMAQLLDAMHVESDNRKHFSSTSDQMDIIASEIMNELGLPLHLKGYGYIKTAALLLCNDDPLHETKMKDIYTKTAKLHQTTYIRVEKAMRTAISFSYRNTPHKICIYNTKPTCSQIIRYISEKIRLQNLYDKEEDDV